MTISHPQPFALAIHGGAGTIKRSALTPALTEGYHAGLHRALAAGHEVLADGGSALDAVTAAVMALEDEPLFNAGRGAVFTAEGVQEMDAAIMDGRDRGAGAVAGLFGPRNPILAARAVMEHSEHVLLIGEGALDLAAARGCRWRRPPISSPSRAGTPSSPSWSAAAPAPPTMETSSAATARWAPSPATVTAILPPPPRPAA